MSSEVSYLKEKLLKHTSFFGLRLWMLIVAFLILFILLVFFIISLCVIYCRRRRSYKQAPCCLPNPIAPRHNYHSPYSTSSLNRRLLPLNVSKTETNMTKPELEVMLSDQLSTRASMTTQESLPDLEHFAKCSPAVSENWTGNHFSLREAEIVTNGFAYENLIGHGDYGVVYRGVLLDHTRVAVKRLLSNSCQTEHFLTEAEAIGNVRHKNLVKLLGYCVEEGYRMLVYEYVNNSNLHQWLHGSLGQTRPLTWTIRLKIIHGIAKGLAYLHEDIEPQIVHQNVKASNILLDHQWNPKISDISLSRLLGPEHSHVTAHSMIKLGYAAQDHDSIRLWDKKNDIYSFGILIMEIVTGRTPVDHNQPQVYLIDWLKSMVANKKIAHVLDPKMPEIPSIKELKRVTLVALRCVDPDLDHRPRMGQVVHMLEPRDLLLNDERRARREASLRNHRQDSQTSEQDGVASDMCAGKRSYNHYEKRISIQHA
ncbi:PREDICTED: probable serine/threonine-protein kinase At1g01540 [Theobroma cacao]|uniref:non-specific serine/threonine protein kinase n=1 Tax=Theobroma cacao TaxID=3641 RepID=A0AB32VDF4_THECC|nr:PREDICTED: probable serine/threonine-protein kinase At1g01540 [Theobroma cacao]